MNASPHPVYVVDDDPSLLKAISRLLSSAGYRVWSYDAPHDFLANVKEDVPGCVILDMHMPKMDGLEVQQVLAKRELALTVIFLTAHGKIGQCVDALKCGAVDFLTKPVMDHSLLAAVNSALAKSEVYFKETKELNVIKTNAAALSPREFEVFSLVVTGMLNKQVADALGTCEKTIKVHRARVMEKMDVESLAELVMAAGRLGVIGKTEAIGPRSNG